MKVKARQQIGVQILLFQELGVKHVVIRSWKNSRAVGHATKKWKVKNLRFHSASFQQDVTGLLFCCLADNKPSVAFIYLSLEIHPQKLQELFFLGRLLQVASFSIQSHQIHLRTIIDSKYNTTMSFIVAEIREMIAIPLQKIFRSWKRLHMFDPKAFFESMNFFRATVQRCALLPVHAVIPGGSADRGSTVAMYGENGEGVWISLFQDILQHQGWT